MDESFKSAFIRAFPNCAIEDIINTTCPYRIFGMKALRKIDALCNVKVKGLDACKRCWDMEVKDFYD